MAAVAEYAQFFSQHLKDIKWRSGGEGSARCPFHDDRRASLSINRESGLWYCHACGIGGAAREFAERVGGEAPAAQSARAAEAVYDYRDGAGALLFQVVRFVGKNFRQRRPDGRDGWVWKLDGTRRVLYRLPELLKSEGDVFIVEGEKDCETLRKQGLTATCNAGGAGKWRAEYGEALNGRVCVLIPDNDEPGRAHMQDVARKLAAVAGRIVTVELPGLAPKGDVSDWLAAGHTIDELRELVASAGRASHAETGAESAAPDGGRDSGEYFEQSGSIMRLCQTRSGPVPLRLTNFTARIARELEYDDGLETRREFEIVATVRGRENVVAVPAAAFAGMGWVTEKLGGSAIVGAGQGNKDHTRAAIQTLSAGHPREALYAHTGWREIEGERVYLHGGGGICGSSGAGDSVRTKLPPALEKFMLPEPSPADDAREAVRASLDLLKLGPARILAPLLAAVYRAVLGGTDFSLSVVGASGVFKSEVAALLQRHFGADFDARNLPMNWSGTANANEATAFAAKDALLVIDDFVPARSMPDRNRQQREAERLFRGAGNRQGRARMSADLSVREGRPPRCLLLSTGEDMPAGHSLGARMLKVEVGSGEIETTRLTACQRDAAAGLYAQAMAAYLRWLAPRLKAMRSLMRERVPDLRAIASEVAAHARTPGIVADLFFGLAGLVAFAVECGAMRPEEADAVSALAWRGLRAAAGEQVAHQQSEEPARRFLELLGSALASGRAHVDTMSGGVPDVTADGVERGPADGADSNDVEMFEPSDGTRPHDRGAQSFWSDRWGWSYHRGQWEPRGPLVGWLDADAGALFLEPDAAYKAAAEMVPDGAGLPSSRTLWKRVAEGGWLRREESRETLKVRVTVAGQRRAVICLRKDALERASVELPDQPDQPDQHAGTPSANEGWSGLWRQIGQVGR